MKQAFNDMEIEVVNTNDYRQWYMTVDQVAQGYGIARNTVMTHLEDHADEIRPGVEKDRIGNTDSIGRERNCKPILYREGVIKLGFFIRSKQAAVFRQWATSLVCEHMDRSGVSQEMFFQALNEIKLEVGEVRKVCSGLRDEVDELKEIVGLIFTDTEERQIRDLIKSVKQTTGKDGRTIVGSVRKTLNLASVYKSDCSKLVINALKNMVGQGLHLVP